MDSVHAALPDRDGRRDRYRRHRVLCYGAAYLANLLCHQLCAPHSGVEDIGSEIHDQDRLRHLHAVLLSLCRAKHHDLKRRPAHSRARREQHVHVARHRLLPHRHLARHRVPAQRFNGRHRHRGCHREQISQPVARHRAHLCRHPHHRLVVPRVRREIWLRDGSAHHGDRSLRHDD